MSRNGFSISSTLNFDLLNKEINHLQQMLPAAKWHQLDLYISILSWVMVKKPLTFSSEIFIVIVQVFV